MSRFFIEEYHFNVPGDESQKDTVVRYLRLLGVWGQT